MNGHYFLEFFDTSGVVLFLALGASLPVAMRHWMSRWFHRVCARVGDVPSTCGLDGHDVAVRLLKASGLHDVPVLSVGSINCYHPWKRQIRLHPATYQSTSISALATAAHEVGHAQHFSERIWRCRLRNVLWPVCWALPVAAALVAVFIILGDVQLSGELLVAGTLIVCALVVVLQFPITLPLERDASQRARKLVRENGLLADHERLAFDRLLSAAWKTHAVSEAQRWVVLGLVAVVVGCFPLFQPILNPSLDGFSADEIAERQAAAAQPVPPAPVPAATQMNLEDFDYEPPSWTSVLSLLPVFSPMVLLGLVALAFLGLSKKISPKQPTREARAILRNNEASALHASGQLEAAIAEYSNAIKLNPQLTVAWYNRAQSYLSAGRLEDAASDFDAAIRLAPHFLDAVAARGEVRLLLGQEACGVADLETVRAQHPAHARALAAEADFWQRRRDFERAISIWTDAIKVAPEKSELHRNRGLMYYFQGNHEQAICDQTTAIRLDPADAIARNNRGAALLKCGSWAAAVEDLRAAIQLDPKLPNSFRHLAWVQATCPQPEHRDGVEAVSNATRALELTDWKQLEWYEVLAAAYAEAGKFEHAISWQQKCLDASTPETHAKWEARLELYRNGQSFREMPVSRV